MNRQSQAVLPALLQGAPPLTAEQAAWLRHHTISPVAGWVVPFTLTIGGVLMFGGGGMAFVFGAALFGGLAAVVLGGGFFCVALFATAANLWAFSSQSKRDRARCEWLIANGRVVRARVLGCARKFARGSGGSHVEILASIAGSPADVRLRFEAYLRTRGAPVFLPMPTPGSSLWVVVTPDGQAGLLGPAAG